MKTEYPLLINQEFLFDWHGIAQSVFHCMTVSQPLKTVYKNCISISGDFLMVFLIFQDIFGQIVWIIQQQARMTEMFLSQIIVLVFLIASFLDEVEECWGNWTCTHRVNFRPLRCLLLTFPGNMCFCWQLKMLTSILWMTFWDNCKMNTSSSLKIDWPL